MLLGVLAGETGVGEGAYTAVAKWTNRMRGGMLMATVGGNAVFGAVSGMSLAANMVFAKIAMPQLRKAKYDESLSMGCIVASGCLDNLIPPSMAIIIFCVLVGDLSIGRALMAGIGPAILLMILMCAMIYLIARLRPGKIPPVGDVHYSLKERLGSLKLLLPVLGVLHPRHRRHVLGALPRHRRGRHRLGDPVRLRAGRRVPVKKMAKAAWEACVMNAGIFPIIIAGTMFSRFIALSRLPFHLNEWFTGINMPPYVVFLIILVFYVFMGCIMDIASIIIITIPVIFPLLAGTRASTRTCW